MQAIIKKSQKSKYALFGKSGVRFGQRHFLDLINNNENCLPTLPSEILTGDFYAIAVKENPSILKYVPNEIKTIEMCLDALAECPSLIEYVPSAADFCINACRQNGNLLAFIPESVRASVAAKSRIKPTAFQPTIVKKSVSSENKARWIKAISENHNALIAINQSKHRVIYRDMEFYALAVNANYLSFMHVPEKFKTYEMSLAVVKLDPMQLKYVPQQLQSYELCLCAASRNIDAFKFIHTSLLTNNLLLELLRIGKLKFFDIPFKYRTDELCYLGCIEGVILLKDIPHWLCYYDFYMSVIRINEKSITSIPSKYENMSFYLNALCINPLVRQFVPCLENVSIMKRVRIQ